MQTIKQPPNSGMCAVCVVAMATYTTPRDVYAFFNDHRVMGDPISDYEESLYLLSRGLMKGGGFSTEGIQELDTVAVRLSDYLDKKPALLEVKSRNHEDTLHAVYWDGRVCRDPDPNMPDETALSDYEIVKVWPLTGCCINKDITQLPSRLQPPMFVLEARKGNYVSAAKFYQYEPIHKSKGFLVGLVDRLLAAPGYCQAERENLPALIAREIVLNAADLFRRTLPDKSVWTVTPLEPDVRDALVLSYDLISPEGVRIKREVRTMPIIAHLALTLKEFAYALCLKVHAQSRDLLYPDSSDVEAYEERKKWIIARFDREDVE